MVMWSSTATCFGPMASAATPRGPSRSGVGRGRLGVKQESMGVFACKNKWQPDSVVSDGASESPPPKKMKCSKEEKDGEDSSHKPGPGPKFPWTQGRCWAEFEGRAKTPVVCFVLQTSTSCSVLE